MDDTAIDFSGDNILDIQSKPQFDQFNIEHGLATKWCSMSKRRSAWCIRPRATEVILTYIFTEKVNKMNMWIDLSISAYMAWPKTHF